MSHLATGRLLLQSAPNGFALVQDLLNTRAIGKHRADLLGSAGSAREWLLDLAQADDVPSPWLRQFTGREPDDGELADLRALRAAVHRLVSGGSGSPGSTGARCLLVLDDDGGVVLQA